MMTNRQDNPRLLVRLALLASAVLILGLAFNLIEYGQVKSLVRAHQLYARRDLLYAAVYLATYIVASAAIVVAVFSRWRVVRSVALAAVFCFLGMEFCCRLLIGGNIGFSEVHTALSELSFAGQFIRSYAASVVKAAVLSGLVTAILLGAVHWSRLRFSPRWLILVPVAGGLIYGVLWRTVAATDVYPSPLRVPVLLLYASLNSLNAGPRHPVEWTADVQDQPRVLILIMDESIRGDHLTINGSARDTTPFLASIAQQYLNFGIACSASNISSASNFIVRTGLRVDQIPDRDHVGLTKPSIFQYAKAAGYRTCYLDAQYAPNVLENFLTRHDLDHIDVAYSAIGDQADPNRRYERDRLLARRILELHADGQPTFIWVNKYGAHIDYDTAYPPSQRVFTPTMQPGRPLDACGLEEIENSFANAILWSVDGFFEQLSPLLGRDDTVIVYTADHGQSFKERRGSAAHADRAKPPTSQANVPMLTFGRHVGRRWPNGLAGVRDRTSHFQLFPTLLVLMGYHEAQVVERYGAPLWGRPPTVREFLSGDVFGRGIVHMNVFDLDRAASPVGSVPAATGAVTPAD